MITLRKIAYEFLKLEAGGDPGPDFPLTQAYAILLARQCLNALLKPEFYDNLNNEDRGALVMCIVPYEVSVSGEVGHQYIDLPEFYIRLPFNKGLHGIAPIEEPTHHFIPRNSPGVTYNLPCADAELQQTYYAEGKKIYFDKEVDLAKVLLKLIVAAPDSIGENDSLPIYPEQQIPLLSLMRATVANRPVHDKVIDGNADIGTKIPH
jgi:hypothetical protein